MRFWPLSVVVVGVVREAARLDMSACVLSASARALSAMGPFERDCIVSLFLTESIVDWAAIWMLGRVSEREAQIQDCWILSAVFDQ